MDEKGRLEGKTAIITGSNRGIGRAAAQLFAKEGADIVINYSKSDDQAKETLKSIQKEGGRAVVVKADVSNEDEVKRLVNTCVEEFGTVDILMNNAAIVGPLKPMIEYTREEWDSVININLTGPFLCMKHVIPIMLEKGRGKIINTSSVSIIGEKNASAYCATKGGLASVTKELTLEYADKGININAICPGAVDTEMLREFEERYPGLIDGIVSRTPAARLATPADIAHAALFLASDESDFVNGLLLFVDGSIMNNVW